MKKKNLVLAALLSGMLWGVGAAPTEAALAQDAHEAAQAQAEMWGLGAEDAAKVERSMEGIFKNNPFGLVYRGAIKENKAGAVNIHAVSYENQEGLKLAANLYLPAGFDENGSYPAIVVAHPNGGIKEQVSGLFAQRLAEAGFVTIAFDAAYQGESEGLPRNKDVPASRTEDIRAALDYLGSVKGVDSSRLGALGICGGGGYTVNVAKTEKRIKAVATLSMFNTGRIRRNGMADADTAGIAGRMQAAAEACEKYARTGEADYLGAYRAEAHHYTADELAKVPAGLYRDGVEYYGDTHYHPDSQAVYTTMSLQDLMSFDAEDQAELIDQPILMIAGEASDTRYMTEDVFQKLGSEDKTLYLVPGAQHIETYWKDKYVNEELGKIIPFFKKNLK